MSPFVAPRAPHARGAGGNGTSGGARRSRTGRGGTLESVIGDAWEGLLDHATVSCPICTGPMRQGPAGAAACHSCGTRLS